MIVAAASEIARRNPGWGGLIASLPMTSLLALLWLWRDSPDALKAADFLLGTTLYVLASLPAFILMAMLLRRGTGIVPALIAGALLAMAGYVLLGWIGRRWGWPV
ncbi:MAG: DUF3147 family protein [Novosphingobium sp.]